MEIFRTVDTEQTITVIPRELLTSVRLYIEDKEQPGNEIDEIVVSTIENEFITVPFSANFFKEGRRYWIVIYNLSDERIWMGEALCTDKTDLQNYKING